MIQKMSGVLLNLNDEERSALEQILFVAQKHIDEVDKPDLVQAMITSLRWQFDIAPPFPPDLVRKEESTESRLRRLAWMRDDYHVSPDLVRCAYVNCTGAVISDSPFLHAWDAALGDEGWTLGSPYETESTDLFCPREHGGGP